MRSVGVGIFAIVIALPLVLSSTGHAAAQADQTSWHVNDDPRLEGPADAWYPGQSGKGFGSNNYIYTYAIGGDAASDNSAVWLMGSRIGRQELEAFVPCNHATATVDYEIRIGTTTYRKEVRQLDACGHNSWTALGQYTTNGQTVSVRLADNAARQHYARDGLIWSSIGIDAVRMRCIEACGTTRPPSTPSGLTITTSPYQNGRILITLEWDAASSPDADSYSITFTHGSNRWPFSSATTKFEVHAPPDNVYGVELRAVNAQGSSEALLDSASTHSRSETVQPDSRVSTADPHDYPYQFTRCPVYDADGNGVYDTNIDGWSFLKGQCTSYVAWKLNDAGIPFTNGFKNGTGLSVRWGNAKDWSNAARRVGIAVDHRPVPGSVANWTTGLWGHVAYVESVSDDGNTIVISESNAASRCGVSASVTLRLGDPRWPNEGSVNFIHFEDVE